MHGRNRLQLPLRRRVTVQPPHGDMDAHAQRLLPWFTVSVPSQLPRSKPPLAKRTPPLLREINRPPRRSRQSRCVAPASYPPRAHLHLHTTPNVHRKRKEKKIFPEGVWLSCLLTVTWMPTLNGSCPGARPKPPQLPLRRRMTVQPPHGDLGANAQRLRRSVTVQPPHGDMDARPPRLLPWCTAETAPSSPSEDV